MSAAIDAAELSALLHDDPSVLVVDVRERDEFAAGSIPGARHLVYEEVLSTLTAEAGQARRIVVVCTFGMRSSSACISLRRAGFSHVSYLGGGVAAWSDAGYLLA